MLEVQEPLESQVPVAPKGLKIELFVMSFYPWAQRTDLGNPIEAPQKLIRHLNQVGLRTAAFGPSDQEKEAVRLVTDDLRLGFIKDPNVREVHAVMRIRGCNGKVRGKSFTVVAKRI